MYGGHNIKTYCTVGSVSSAGCVIQCQVQESRHPHPSYLLIVRIVFILYYVFILLKLRVGYAQFNIKFISLFGACESPHRIELNICTYILFILIMHLSLMLSYRHVYDCIINRHRLLYMCKLMCNSMSQYSHFNKAIDYLLSE